MYPRTQASPKLILLSCAPRGCEFAAAPSILAFRHTKIQTSWSHSWILPMFRMGTSMLHQFVLDVPRICFGAAAISINMGRLVRTDLISTRRSPYDNILPIQLLNFFSKRSSTGFHFLFLNLRKWIGIPKYLNGNDPISHLKEFYNHFQPPWPCQNRITSSYENLSSNLTIVRKYRKLILYSKLCPNHAP
jgi:hypothetical protein